ncbi:MAG TPA: hypothetical protein PLK35_02195 [Candidatus Moranbacteria bacterium]|nr:hypothetical protein [Candidatus Moranbacteria bacterium]
MNPYVVLIIIVAVFVFLIYLLIDFASSNANAFMDKWAKKTLWIWLPFYGLWRLVREVILKKRIIK